MDNNDPEITDQELLDILQEECLEVGHIISKIRRFGLYSHHPNKKKVNRNRLSEEIGDFIGLMGELMNREVIDKRIIHKSSGEKKIDKLKKYAST